MLEKENKNRHTYDSLVRCLYRFAWRKLLLCVRVYLLSGSLHNVWFNMGMLNADLDKVKWKCCVSEIDFTVFRFSLLLNGYHHHPHHLFNSRFWCSRLMHKRQLFDAFESWMRITKTYVYLICIRVEQWIDRRENKKKVEQASNILWNANDGETIHSGKHGDRQRRCGVALFHIICVSASDRKLFEMKGCSGFKSMQPLEISNSFFSLSPSLATPNQVNESNNRKSINLFMKMQISHLQ